MRKIISEKQKNKRKIRNQLIIGLILIGVMFFSVIAGSFMGFHGSSGNSDISKIEYNGFEFIEQENSWLLNVGKSQFIFRYNPNEIEGIDSNVKKIENYYNLPLYISSESNEAELEIYRNFYPFAQRIQRACFEEDECDENLPIKNCEDNFIIIRKNDYSNISQQENCVFISGQIGNLTKLTDEFLFKVLDIIP